MTGREAEPPLVRHSEDTVDISRIEASDSVQSHLSSTTSSKRIKLPPNSTPDTSGTAFNLDALSTQPERFSQVQRIAVYARTLLLPDSPLLPTAGRPTRVECSWTRMIAKSAFLFYCALSCLITSVRLYVSIFEPREMGAVRGPVPGSAPEISRSFAQYLTRSSMSSSNLLEPFVVKSENSFSNVTICAWLPDSKLHLLENWVRGSQVSLSLLITTSAPFSSPQHKDLLGAIRQRLPPSSTSRASIHLFHVKETEVGSSNVYLNIARLFTFTDWTLMFPGELNNPFPPRLQEIISSINFEAELGAYLLTAGAHVYPFPDFSPLLLRKDRDFWCTERFFAGVSRASDWNECLWQLYLKMTGKIVILDVPSGTKVVSGEDKASTPEGAIRQRLTSRYRAEMCDTFLKHIASIYPRTRHRNMELEWAKTFCAKTVNRKLNR